MPGLNKQGPSGEGPLTGRQQGMCRRTKDLTLTTGGDRRRGKGGRWLSTDQQGRQMAQSRRRSAQGEEPVVVDKPESVENELAELKKRYKEVSAVLTEIESKIAFLESKAAYK